ncbi:MAG: DUF6273 domain-containing protein, partial [Muribaculaceae bacterium]|nr:DUF6273 domain-containing protein [Muribaculaceae bacterium]
MQGKVTSEVISSQNINYKGRPLQALLSGLEDLAETSRAISAVPKQLKIETYDGSEKELILDGFDGAAMLLSGTTKATDMGWYEAIVTPKTGYYWMSDGSSSSRIIRWRIGGIPVAIPATPTPQTYTGTALSPAWGDDYDDDVITASGDTTATAAGSHSVSLSLAENHEWSDGTTTDKVIVWVINKDAGTLALNKSSLTLNLSAMTGYIGVTRAGDGTISARSSDTSVADVQVQGEQVAVTGKKTGSATITISVGEGTNHLAPASKTVSVSCSVPSNNPDEATASDIKQLVSAGLIGNYFAEGDDFPVTCSGTVMGQSVSGNFAVRFLEMNHNSSREGTGRAHFLFPASTKTANKNLAFCHTATLHNYVPMGSQGFYMNPQTSTSTSSNDYYGTTQGGWRDSKMRTQILPELLKCLPSDWQNIIANSTKYTSNGDRSKNNTQAEVTSTSDKLWLFSEFEVFGVRSNANEYEKNFQTQYKYWANGNDKRFYNHTSEGSAVNTWLRSPNATSPNNF